MKSPINCPVLMVSQTPSALPSSPTLVSITTGMSLRISRLGQSCSGPFWRPTRRGPMSSLPMKAAGSASKTSPARRSSPPMTSAQSPLSSSSVPKAPPPQPWIKLCRKSSTLVPSSSSSSPPASESPSAASGTRFSLGFCQERVLGPVPLRPRWPARLPLTKDVTAGAAAALARNLIADAVAETPATAVQVTAATTTATAATFATTTPKPARPGPRHRDGMGSSAEFRARRRQS
mmetsp:Transcript_97666/g.280604  ORF Transcript_97666/g.280604 Transcript_97666/m.280604 type:complete len:234 (-) Transcript_97666:3-704(-)